jgi:hypothetical protein
MDPVTLVYYATVCALLARFLPPDLGRPAKLALGAAVGLVSAAVLPVLRGLAGGAL